MSDTRQMDADEPSTPRPAFSSLSVARSVWKTRGYVLSIWVLLTVCVIVGVKYLPEVYVSEAVILVDSQKIPEKFVSATVASDLEDRIAAIRQQILSSGELKRVIDDLGLYAEERETHFEEEILEMMRKDVSITLEPMKSMSTRRPGAFRIGYQGHDPVLVTRVANRLTDLYVEQNLKTREGQAEGTSEFLKAQLREAKARLDEMEAAVSAYKLKHTGELPQQEQSLGSTLARLQVELEANRDAINRAQQSKVVLSTSLNSLEASLVGQTRLPAGQEQSTRPTPLDTFTGQTGTPVRKRVDVLQTDLDAMRARYSDDHPDVVRTRAELQSARRTEAAEAASVIAPPGTSAGPGGSRAQSPGTAADSPEIQRIRQQIVTSKAQLTGVEKELESRAIQQERILRDIAGYQSRIEHLPIREQEMAQLTRDYEMSKDNYRSLLDKQLAAEMALDMERRQKSERFTILDRAKVPAKPVKPNKPLLYGVGSLGSLLFGLIAGFLLELRRNVFLGEWELPAGTTVLARLPYIEIPVSAEPETGRGRRL